jgi:membrane protease YdiL (CAAX protease family)
MKKEKKGVFLFLWFLCILGGFAKLPYEYHLGVIPSSAITGMLFVQVGVGTAVFFGVVLWLCYLLIPRTDLSPFQIDRPMKRIVYPGLIAGICVGLLLVVLNATVFAGSSLSAMHPPPLAASAASVYGAINEEVLVRLFVFTLIYFLFGKIFRFKKENRLTFLWLSNVIAALLFGVGHLPAAFKLISPSTFEVSRILLLNAIPGLTFGWLYWSRGIWTAMAAHFVTDLVYHAIFI